MCADEDGEDGRDLGFNLREMEDVADRLLQLHSVNILLPVVDTASVANRYRLYLVNTTYLPTDPSTAILETLVVPPSNSNSNLPLRYRDIKLPILWNA